MSETRWLYSYGCRRLDRIVKVGLPRRPAPGQFSPKGVQCPCGEVHPPSEMMARDRRPQERCDVNLRTL